ncbi:cation transporter [candidate division KSB1 bacterium]|nr:cation transporter [candidate division KSB1 bacterium]MDL1875616.1 cation transporter [Cytophagia bacterium CHB2]
MNEQQTEAVRERAGKGMRATFIGVLVNAGLAFIKVIAGVLGNSYALIADGVESTLDIFSTTVVWGGLKIAAKPPDANHPFGHGKAEPLAALVVALALLGAALGLIIQSIREILTPHHTPAPFTLLVLIIVVITKELLFRSIFKVGENIKSTAVRGDAWHHRSDALTSVAAFVGIAIALLGGEGYESADDWAALFACVIIGFNGVRLLRGAVSEVMDTAPPATLEQSIRVLAQNVEGVRNTEKCRVRKSGLMFFVDIHVIVDGEASVRRGHEIAHEVKDRLLKANLDIFDVLVHIEPDAGRLVLPQKKL